MPVSRKLKVFRTPIGFHDAYVAVPTKKAALEAWGSDHNLFARGEAELVEDPALTAEPLAHPGRVIRRLRGTAEEQIAALRPKEVANVRDKGLIPNRKPAARPDRTALDEAQAAVTAAERRHAGIMDEISREEERLRQRRRAAERSRDAELSGLRRKSELLRDDYEKKLDLWREAPV